MSKYLIKSTITAAAEWAAGPNAFTVKPDLTNFMKGVNKSQKASINTSQITKKQFIINASDPRHNPYATEQEKKLWKLNKTINNRR